MEITVVIPTYNEVRNIKKGLTEIIKYCKENFDKYEIIVVDDSDDDTARIARSYSDKNIKVIKNKIRRGKGYSVKQGVLASQYSLVLFCDIDLATPIRELGKMLEYIAEGYDIVIGSRNLENSIIRERQPFHRRFMGKSFASLVKFIAVSGFEDTQCGFKLFKADAAKEIFPLQTISRFSFDVELLFIAKKLGYKIKEVPVTWNNDPDSRVNVIKDTTRMLADLFRIRSNDLLGKYRK